MRASQRKLLSAASLETICQECFGSAAIEGDSVRTEYGAITRLVARPAGAVLSIDLTMNPKVPEDVARETIRRYNQFLESATGFSSKERAKRLRKSAVEGG